jgi:hypothetical protein
LPCVNVIGVMLSNGEMKQIQKDGKTLKKRQISICDESGYKIQTCLWNENAFSIDLIKVNIIQLTNCRISSFGGISLNQHNDTKI